MPISDATDIQASLWEQVAWVGINGWASSAIHSTTNIKSDARVMYLPSSGVVEVDEIFGIIRSQQLLLSVLYPSDTLSLNVGLYDSDGNNLFYGYASTNINPSQGGVSKNTLGIVLEMNSEVWIPFTGARWFEVVEHDQNNNPVRYYSSREYDVQNGKMRFPLYFGGKLGYVRVGLCNGTEVAYSLKGGNKIVPTAVQTEVGKISALGVRTFRDTLVIHVEVFGRGI